MWIPDGRGGSISPAALEAKIAGRFPSRPRQALLLVETEEETWPLYRAGFAYAYPTHGPAAIRVLADYPELAAIPVVILYRNDSVGRAWAHTAASILLQMGTQVRLWSQPQSIEMWLRHETPDDLRQQFAKLRPIRPIDIHYDPLAGGENRCLRILNMSGCRLLPDAVGIWEDMDSGELLQALDALGIEEPVIFLDDETLASTLAPCNYWRMRMVPYKMRSESFDNYEKRTGY